MVFHGIGLDIGVEDPTRRVAAAHGGERLGGEGPAAEQLPEEGHLAGEGLRRPGVALLGQERREEGVARRVGGRGALPHRELPRARLPHRRVRRHGQGDRLGGALRVQAEQARRAAGDRQRDVVDVVPAVGAQAGAVAERDADLVGDRDGVDQRGAAQPAPLRQGQQRGDDVAGVQRLQREVGVVEVEVANQQAVDEGGALRRRPPRRPADRRAVRQREGRGVGRRAPPGVAVERGNHHAARVDHAPLDLLRHLGRRGDVPVGGIAREQPLVRVARLGHPAPCTARGAPNRG